MAMRRLQNEVSLGEDIMIKLNDIKMKPKLITLFLLVGIIPLVLVGWWSSRLATNALMEKSFGQLESARGIKKAQVEKYFAEREGDIQVLVETVGSLRTESFRKLGAIQDLKKAQVSDYIATLKSQLALFSADPYSRQALIEFDRAFEEDGDKTGGTAWSALANKYDARMQGIMDKFGWYDLFLIHTDGDIVYTVEKESDLGMIIPDSNLRNSSLGNAFQKAVRMDANEIAVGDFKPYGPSGGIPSAFMMTQMRDENGKFIGLAALQVPLKKFNDIMLRRNGMGKTGESYLVGQDGLMRSDSFLDPEGHSVVASFQNNTRVDTEPVRSALSGKSGQEVIIDYNGNPVLSAWDPIDIGDGIRWAMMSEIDVAEAFSPVDDSGNEFLQNTRNYTDTMTCS